jgi:prophage maintenance system killer protein
LESEAFIFGPANKGTALAILKKYLRINDQEAEEGYKDVITGLTESPTPLAGEKRSAINETAQSQSREVKVEELVDDRFMKNWIRAVLLMKCTRYGVK